MFSNRLVSTSMEKGCVDRFQVGRESVFLFRLQFANDSLLFCLGKERSFVNLNRLFSFEVILDLKINRCKR